MLLSTPPPPEMSWTYLMVAVLVIILIGGFGVWPQRRHERVVREFQRGIKPGAEVLLSSGVVGHVVEVVDERLVKVEVAPGVILTVQRDRLQPPAV